MPGTIFGIPFDEELFLQSWNEAPDPIKSAMIKSGAMVDDAVIGGLIQGSGNLYTIPFYNALDGDPVNYDGRTDIVATEITGGSQSGIVYGRGRSFLSRNFTAELSGADPMGYIAKSVAKYWQKVRQKEMLNILNGVFSVSGTSGNPKAFKDSHIVDLCSTTAIPYEIGIKDLNDVATKALGDNKSLFRLAIMHSNVAKTLENLQVLEFWKQTDPGGLQRNLAIADINGYTVIIDDDVPTKLVGGTGENKALMQYTTYLLGDGVLRHANGRIDIPAEPHRDPAKNGGQDELITRIRETVHPNGFSFKIPTTGWADSPTSAQLAAGANWDCLFNPKSIPIAKLLTNG